MPLFSLELQVEYASVYEHKAYRSRIFWVSKDRTIALAIPEYTCVTKTRKPFNQDKRTKDWTKFIQPILTRGNRYILDEPPIAYHALKASNKTRIKLDYEYHSYVYNNGKFMLNLDPKYTKNLPMPYYGQYIKTCYFCENGTDYNWIQNRYGV